MILSSLQRLGLTPPQEWLDVMGNAFLASIQTQEQATMMRSDNFTKPLVGLAGLGWKPTPEQWQRLVEASRSNIAQGYYKARQLMEVAWAFAQFGSPVSMDWSQVRQVYGVHGVLGDIEKDSVLDMDPWSFLECACCSCLCEVEVNMSLESAMNTCYQCVVSANWLHLPAPTFLSLHRLSTTRCSTSPSTCTQPTSATCCTAWPTSRPSPTVISWRACSGA